MKATKLSWRWLSGFGIGIAPVVGVASANEAITAGIASEESEKIEEIEMTDEEITDYFNRVKSAKEKKEINLILPTNYKYVDLTYVAPGQTISSNISTSILDSFEREMAQNNPNKNKEILRKIQNVNKDLQLEVINWTYMKQNRDTIAYNIYETLWKNNKDSASPLSKQEFDNYFEQIVLPLWNSEIDLAIQNNLNQSEFNESIDIFLDNMSASPNIKQVKVEKKLQDVLSKIENNVSLSSDALSANSWLPLMQWSKQSTSPLDWNDPSNNSFKIIMQKYFVYKQSLSQSDLKQLSFNNKELGLIIQDDSFLYSNLSKNSLFNIKLLQDELGSKYTLKFELLPYAMQKLEQNDALMPLSKAFYASQKIDLTIKVTITSNDNFGASASQCINLSTPISSATKKDFVNLIINDSGLFKASSSHALGTIVKGTFFYDKPSSKDEFINHYKVTENEYNNSSLDTLIATYAHNYDALGFFSKYNHIGQTIDPDDADDLILFTGPSPVGKDRVIKNLNDILKEYGYKVSLRLSKIHIDYYKHGSGNDLRSYAPIDLELVCSTLNDELWDTLMIQTPNKPYESVFFQGPGKQIYVEVEGGGWEWVTTSGGLSADPIFTVNLWINDDINKKITIVQNLLDQYDSFKKLSSWKFNQESLNSLAMYADGNLALSIISLVCSTTGLALTIIYALTLNIPASTSSLIVGVLFTIIGAISIVSAASLMDFKIEMSKYWNWFDDLGRNNISLLVQKLDIYKLATVDVKLTMLDDLINTAQDILPMPNQPNMSLMKPLADGLDYFMIANYAIVNGIFTAIRFLGNKFGSDMSHLTNLDIDEFKRDVTNPMRKLASSQTQSSYSLDYVSAGVSTIWNVVKNGIFPLMDLYAIVASAIKASRLVALPLVWAVPIIPIAVTIIDAVSTIVNNIFKVYFSSQNFWFD